MYKVKATVVAFLGDVEHFPCHFGYKIGDSFIYDGEKFIGRICPSLFPSNMLAVFDIIRYSGNIHFGYFPWNYSGISRREPKNKKYDGVGWANVDGAPKGAREDFVHMTLPIPTERRGVGQFSCDDPRTHAIFIAEPCGLSDKGFDRPFYMRAMSILDKIKAEARHQERRRSQEIHQVRERRNIPQAGAGKHGPASGRTGDNRIHYSEKRQSVPRRRQEIQIESTQLH